MVVILSLPVFISALLISAHFYRSDSMALAIISILVPLLLLCKNRWVPKIITIFLLLAAGEWLRTMIEFIVQYQALGASWTRLAVILTSVSVCTALSAMSFKTFTMKSRYSK